MQTHSNMKALMVTLLVGVLLSCKQRSVDSIQQTSMLELKYGAKDAITLKGKTYTIQFIDLVEERCADCTTCYKPNGIYANTILLINGEKKTLRIYSCTLSEELTWETIVKNQDVISIDEFVSAGVARLAPSSPSGEKEFYSVKIILNY